MIINLKHRPEHRALPKESDPRLQELLLKAREALRKAASQQRRSSAIVIQFPADRVVRNTVPRR